MRTTVQTLFNALDKSDAGKKAKKVHQGEKLLLLVRSTKDLQKDIAKAFGISPQYLSKLFHMEELPAAMQLKAIQYFSLPSDYFQKPIKPEKSESDQLKDLRREIVRIKKQLENQNLTNKMLLRLITLSQENADIFPQDLKELIEKLANEQNGSK